MTENSPVSPTPDTPQPLFVAECVYTEGMWRAIYRVILRRPLFTVLDILLCLIGFFTVGSYVMSTSFGAVEGQEQAFVIWLFCLPFLLYLVLKLFYPRLYARRQNQAQLSLYGQPKTTRVWFYEEHALEMEFSSGGQVTIPYANIQRAVVTPEFILLSLPHRVFIPVERGRFLCGSPDGLISFLKQRNPHIKLVL